MLILFSIRHYNKLTSFWLLEHFLTFNIKKKALHFLIILFLNTDKKNKKRYENAVKNKSEYMFKLLFVPLQIYPQLR
jgi:hypothetical protein